MALLIEVSKDKIPVEGRILDGKPLVVGSHPACGIRLEGAGIEPEHARLEQEGEHFILHRLARREPLLVNGRRVISSVVAADDTIGVGEFELTFRPEGENRAIDLNALRTRIHGRLVEKMNFDELQIDQLSDKDLWQRCSVEVDSILEHSYLPGGVDRDRIKLEVLREALGLGPLEELLAEPEVTEIMVNSKDEIFVERHGRLQREEGMSFTTNEQVVNVIARIVNPLGRRIDESSPLVDARLKDGSRVNAVIRPLALRGPSITIRKFPEKRLETDDLVKFGSLTESMATFLRFAVEGRRSMIISGGTGSGKTTLLNVLSNFIPKDERVVTIEDSAELKLYQPNLVSLEARPANIEGTGAIPIRDLVKNALRMRPDRIIVGECRSGEALDMLQAMNTGHDGSLTTLHANAPHDAILRVETMVMMAGFDLPVRVIRSQIASAVHLLIQQNRLTDGSRKILSITELTGLDGDEVLMRDIFAFRRTGFDSNGHVEGFYTATGYIPRFVEEFERMGIPIDRSIFVPDEREQTATESGGKNA